MISWLLIAITTTNTTLLFVLGTVHFSGVTSVRLSFQRRNFKSSSSQ